MGSHYKYIGKFSRQLAAILVILKSWKKLKNLHNLF